jgi:glycerol kinase
MTDRNVPIASKGLRRTSKEAGSSCDYINLSWALIDILETAVVWKSCSGRFVVNAIDRQSQSVEKRATEKKSQERLDFASMFLGPWRVIERSLYSTG